jgi:hypothetical protein
MTTRNTLITLLVSTVCCALLNATAHAQNLVTNGDFAAGNVGFTSDYAFVASGTSSQPGTYAIRTDSQSFNAGNVEFADHTTGTGNMMLVDGRFNFTAWSETISANPNTSYNFAVWVASSNNDVNQPTLRLLVNSVQVGSDFALTPGTAGQWVNLAAIWNSGGSTSATLSIVDVNSNDFAAGNDFALDDIAFVGVPEPNTYRFLIVGGLLLCGFLARRRRRG